MPVDTRVPGRRLLDQVNAQANDLRAWLAMRSAADGAVYLTNAERQELRGQARQLLDTLDLAAKIET